MADRISGSDAELDATGSAPRDERGRFAPGNPGKAKGTRNRATQAVERILEGHAEALTERAVELALEGDTTALRLCLERIAPPRKDSLVTFKLPDIADSTNIVKATSSLLQAVAGGELTPTESQSIGNLLQAHTRAVELGELRA